LISNSVDPENPFFSKEKTGEKQRKKEEKKGEEKGRKEKRREGERKEFPRTGENKTKASTSQ